MKFGKSPVNSFLKSFMKEEFTDARTDERTDDGHNAMTIAHWLWASGANNLKFASERVKTLWEKEKMLVTSIFSFSHNVFKISLFQGR